MVSHWSPRPTRFCWLISVSGWVHKLTLPQNHILLPSNSLLPGSFYMLLSSEAYPVSPFYTYSIQPWLPEMTTKLPCLVLAPIMAGLPCMSCPWTLHAPLICLVRCNTEYLNCLWENCHPFALTPMLKVVHFHFLSRFHALLIFYFDGWGEVCRSGRKFTLLQEEAGFVVWLV